MPRQTLTQQLADTRRQLAQVQQELNAARLTCQSADDVLENYKAKVRIRAIEVKQEMDWCGVGFNEVMRDLELPLLPHTFKVKMTVTATRELEIEVNADDLELENRNEDGVRSYLDDIGAVREYIYNEIGYGNWDLAKANVTEVEALTD